MSACRDALDNSTWQQHRGLASCVLAMAEYEYFINMMSMAAEDFGIDASEEQQQQRHDERGEPAGDDDDVDRFGEPVAAERRQGSRHDEDDGDFM